MNVVLFDLDDTLLDYSGRVEESWAHAVHTCCTDGRVEPAALVAALLRARQWFWDDPGRQRRERTNMVRAWELIVRHALESLRAPYHDLVGDIVGAYASHRRQVMDLFPEARPTLDRLREQGIPLGLVTNGDASQQRYKIERHGLAPYFDVMVIEGEFGAGKPDPVVFRHALDTWGPIPPRRAWWETTSSTTWRAPGSSASARSGSTGLAPASRQGARRGPTTSSGR